MNCHDSEEDFRAGVKEYGVTWQNAFQGTEGAPIADMWGVRGFPTMHIIGADGRIEALDVRGPIIERTIDRLIAELEKSGEGALR